MSSVGNIFQSTNPYEKFVQQLVELESQTKYKLQAQQGVHRERKDALGAVSSSISKFNSKLEELQDKDNNAFHPLKTSSSNEKAIRVNSASGIDRPSVYNIDVERLATRDVALAQVMSAEGTDLASYGSGSVTLTIGDQTETITLETQKDDGDGNMVDMTNHEILDAFASQITEHFGDHAQANVFQVNNDEVQFSIQSLNTGHENRIQFSDADGVLDTIINGSGDDQVLAMHHLVDQMELDARFTIDGVTFERADNLVDDAVTGLNFELLRTTTETEQMSVQRDTEKARSNVNSFVSAFNEMNKTIRDRTFIDAEGDRRGALQNMRGIRNLTLNLRQIGLQSMDGMEPGQVGRLADMGISFDKDGTMRVDDSEKLDEVLAERPGEVQAFFTSEESPINLMLEQAESFTKARTGIIASMEDGIDQQLSRLDNRIAAQDRHLEQYEQRQRAEFAKLQQIITQGEDQFNQVMMFQQRLGMF
ncbi:flagellar filament capping protein FliD [Balneolales bacterium ANBcel1]|nr:flagellar filament capping protein FliD [Balneolales bacterium ANBcel1]